MTRAKALYHRLVPATVRNPIGLLRRDLTDRLKRLMSREPLPPRSLLANIQLTPWVEEYLEVGSRSAATVERLLVDAGVAPGSRLLDFGCGSGRTLRHLVDRWRVSGCDVDAEAVAWAGRSFPAADVTVNASSPPLSYPDGTFDAALAISLFTHFGQEEQLGWSDELARVLRPGGIAVISTMGPSVLPNFPTHATRDNLDRLDRDGFVYIDDRNSFNARAAFHTPRGLRSQLSRRLELVYWEERGLDGFQDVSLWRRK